MGALLIVRAEVAEADRADFDRWYADEHLPDAVRTFGALSARRGWLDGEGVHLAFYDFPDAASGRAAVASEGMKRLIEDFDRAWPAVRRRREIVEMVQSI